METRKIAEMMFEVGAVKRGEFVLSSGKKSDIYIDVKLACTYPEILNAIAECMAEMLDVEFDVLACVELGGVPVTTALALKTGKRMAIFRKKKKDYGIRDDLIGEIRRGERVVVVEDVTTTGSSAMSVVERVNERGGEVVLVLTVVDRKEGSERLPNLRSVLTIDDLR